MQTMLTILTSLSNNRNIISQKEDLEEVVLGQLDITQHRNMDIWTKIENGVSRGLR